METIYYKGNKAEYTGKSEFMYGCWFFQIRILEGRLKGTLKDTSKCPDCGLTFSQDQPSFNPCQTCTKEAIK